MVVTFESSVPQLRELINKRRRSWKLYSVMGWEDVESHLLTEIWKSWKGYDPSRPLDRWANTVITSRLRNLLRQHLFKTARPCIAASSYGNPCVYNLGGDKCGWTKSGKQCGQCKFFAKWEEKKQAKFVIANPVSIEDHVNESHSIMSDFLDYDSGKKMIDEKIIPLLTKEEARIYRLLYIKGLSEKEVGKRMKFKMQSNSEIPGYLIIREANKRFYILSKKILDREGLI